MNKPLLILALLSALTVSAPAHAEFGSNHDRGYGSNAKSHGNFGGQGGGFKNTIRGLLDLGRGDRGGGSGSSKSGGPGLGGNGDSCGGNC